MKTVQKAFNEISELQIFGSMKFNGDILTIDFSDSESLKRRQMLQIREVAAKYNLWVNLSVKGHSYRMEFKEGIRRISQNMGATIIKHEPIEVYKKVYGEFSIDGVRFKIKREKGTRSKVHIVYTDTSVFVSLFPTDDIEKTVEEFKEKFSKLDGDKHEIVHNFILKDF